MMRNLGGRLIQAQEAERTRIARELHDDIHQQLVMLSINLEQLHQSLPESAADINQKLSEAREQLYRVSTDIHALSHRLHSPKLDYLGLASAAASFCREFSHRQKVKIDFHAEGIPQELPKEVSLCLYRVLQEAFQNAVKHGSSPRVDVSLIGRSNEIQLTVRDWGTGFDLAEAVKGPGLGLTSMKERMKLVDGDLSIDSQPQRGTTIQARVPLKT
jgi:signal transduction histidine kinase